MCMIVCICVLTILKGVGIVHVCLSLAAAILTYFDCCIPTPRDLWCTYRKQAASVAILSLRKIGIVNVT